MSELFLIVGSNNMQSFASPSSLSLYAPAINTNIKKDDIDLNVETRQRWFKYKQKNLLVIYDNEFRSELLSNTVTWIETCGNYQVTILSIRNNDFRNNFKRVGKKK